MASLSKLASTLAALAVHMQSQALALGRAAEQLREYSESDECSAHRHLLPPGLVVGNGNGNGNRPAPAVSSDAAKRVIDGLREILGGAMTDTAGPAKAGPHRKKTVRK